MSKQYAAKRYIELEAWLADSAPELAALYSGAVELVGNQSFPGRLRFISHAAREICNTLPYELCRDETRIARLDYTGMFNSISNSWPKPGDGFTETAIPNAKSVTISGRLVRKIDKYVRMHRARMTRDRASELLFSYLSSRNPNQLSANKRAVQEFMACRKWFVGHAHVPDSKSGFTSSNDVEKMFRTLEDTLHSFVGNYFTLTAGLDDVLEQANSREDPGIAAAAEFSPA